MHMTYDMKKSVPLSFFLLFKKLIYCPTSVVYYGTEWDVINQLKRRTLPPSVGEVDDTFLELVKYFMGTSHTLTSALDPTKACSRRMWHPLRSIVTAKK